MIDGISTISTLKHKKANNRNINIFNICFQILMNVGQLAHVINFVQTCQAVIHVLAELDSQWMPTKNVKVKIHYNFCFPISKNGRLKMVWHRIRIMCSIKQKLLFLDIQCSNYHHLKTNHHDILSNFSLIVKTNNHLLCHHSSHPFIRELSLKVNPVVRSDFRCI